MEAKEFINKKKKEHYESGRSALGIDGITTLLADWMEEYANAKNKELHKENQELVNKVLKEVENGSRSREELSDLKLSIEPTQTIINGFANLFNGYVKEKGLKEELKDQTMTAFNLNEIRKDQYKTIEKLKAKCFDKEDLELIFDKFDYHDSFEKQFNEYFGE